eukprot:gene8227-14164_t
MTKRKPRKEINGLKGNSPPRSKPSPGMVTLKLQWGPDRHQATEVSQISIRKSIRVGTWNVRALFQSGKLQNVKQEMTRIGLDILGEQNDRGERFVQLCTSKEQVITNIWFEEHPRRLWTWRSPGGQVKNQIDYITIKIPFRNPVHHCKTYPSADCGSDHLPVVCKIKLKLKQIKKGNREAKLQYAKLMENPGIRMDFNIEVKKRFDALKDNVFEEDDEVNTCWKNSKESVVSAAKKV